MMKIALAPLNPTIGAIDANADLIAHAARDAAEASCDVVVTPELVVCGYPPRDLLLLEGFVERCEAASDRVASDAPRSITLIIGCPYRMNGAIANGLLVYRDGERVARYAKRLLPTYDVFDEDRYFLAGNEPCVVDVAGTRVGLAICEDLWRGEDARAVNRYRGRPDPMKELADAGAQIVAVASASPVVLGKDRLHASLLERHAREHNVAVASVNQVGANDELIFDGEARLLDAEGKLVAIGADFSDDLLVCGLPDSMRIAKSDVVVDDHADEEDPARAFQALRLGVGDYARKTGFTSAVLGISGGVDSALVCALAASALGPENVIGIRMPGKYSSEHSLTDAAELIERLGVRSITLPIGGPFETLRDMLDNGFRALDERLIGETLPDLTEQNLQSRIRGTTVMAVSNRTGALPLTTGNKSEIAVGYSTLYGDMNGGLAVISDVKKNLAYDICRWMNANPSACGFDGPPIPKQIITKPPSAELAPDQLDSDSLPPYDVLDEIVQRYVEDRQSPETIMRETGFGEDMVSRMIRQIKLNEYKRRQLATGLKLTPVAFGVGWRMPIARG